MTLVIFGDSLVDNGNLTALLSNILPPDQLPFPDPPYNDGKASNGLVLGESVAQELGIDPESIIPRLTLSTPPNVLENNLNYAVAGSTTGFLGSQVFGAGILPIGLQIQTKLFQSDLKLISQTTVESNEIDVFINSGGNDVFDVLNNVTLLKVIITPTDRDDQRLINQTATKIANNINQAVQKIDDFVDDLVIFGLPPVGNSPYAIQADYLIDQRIPGDVSGKTRDLLSEIAAEVSNILMDQFDNPRDDVENVLVIDGFDVFNNSLSQWQNYLSSEGKTGVTEISYLDYLQGTTDLPPGLGIEQFVFFDQVHPTSEFNQFLAEEISPRISSEYSDFAQSV